MKRDFNFDFIENALRDLSSSSTKFQSFGP